MHNALEVYDQIREACGDAIAQRLFAAAGGIRIWVPEEPRPSHVLAQLVGLDDARAIAKAIGSGPLSVPKPESIRRQDIPQQVIALRRDGLSVPQIALKLGISERSVYRHIDASERTT
ncbi:MAG TPA: helix-turn-helix domain-containing protein [Defluviicoccus sp.]|nr:helix-turn-helix domain-containing protein [Defluviicoccus sp.]